MKLRCVVVALSLLVCVGVRSWSAEGETPGPLRLVLAEFDGEHPNGQWDIHNYPYGDGTFDFQVGPDTLRMADKENKNQHLTRRGFLLDPRSHYAIQASFAVKPDPKAPSSFCLNFHIAGEEGTFEPISCWAINVSVQPKRGADCGGISFNMGFVRNHFKRIGLSAIQEWPRFDTEYTLRVDVNADREGNYKLNCVSVSVMQGDQLVHRRQIDYSPFPYQPDLARAVRIGVNSHGGNWTMHDLQVYCDREPILNAGTGKRE